jgi:hypothetical protein
MGDAADEMRDLEEGFDELRGLHETKKCGGVIADCPLCIMEDETVEVEC